MKLKELELKGSYLIELEPKMDDRGFFVRAFCKKELEQINPNFDIKQINQTLTKQKGALRGMHFQLPPYAETKIVRCLKGEVFDVIIDLRENSPTFLKWHGEILSGENMRALYIPKGFAHGFQTLKDSCEMLYYHDEFYNKNAESAIRYNDPKVGIEWKLEVTEISERDKTHKYIDETFKGIEL